MSTNSIHEVKELLIFLNYLYTFMGICFYQINKSTKIKTKQNIFARQFSFVEKSLTLMMWDIAKVMKYSAAFLGRHLVRQISS